MSVEEYIVSLTALNNNAFSRDCYFYYVVPDDLKQQVAVHFADEKWMAYLKLSTVKERIQYCKVMCRHDNNTDTETEEDASSTVSEQDEDDEAETVTQPAMMCPYSYSTVKQPRKLIQHVTSSELLLLISLLLAVLTHLVLLGLGH
jgi:hypothetical protein